MLTFLAVSGRFIKWQRHLALKWSAVVVDGSFKMRMLSKGQFLSFFHGYNPVIFLFIAHSPFISSVSSFVKQEPLGPLKKKKKKVNKF